MSPFESNAERLKLKTYNENGELIVSWDESLGWFEDGVEQNEYGEWLMNRIYHPYTEEQLAAIQLEKDKAALIESRRQLTLEEVTALFIKEQSNAVDVPDQTSLRMMSYYPTFDEIVGRTVKQGFKFTYKSESDTEAKLYKTAQANLTIQKHYPPGLGTESLYTRIDLEHTGMSYDPIPYDGNMELFEGLHYSQNGVIYLCERSTGAAVHHALTELVGLYVKVV